MPGVGIGHRGGGRETDDAMAVAVAGVVVAAMAVALLVTGHEIRLSRKGILSCDCGYIWP